MLFSEQFYNYALWSIYNILILIVPSERNPHEDKGLSIVQLAKKYKYGLEQHSVITEDGYILKLFRISKSLQKAKTGTPILLMHGLELSSYVWVHAGPKKGLAYLLADAGYDVWLGNARGNKHSRNNTKLNPNEEKFWEFSFNEMGYYDLPATINYIIKTSGYEKIFYIGFSQGGTSYYVMASTRPEMNDKIILGITMAPGVFCQNTRSVYHLAVAAQETFFERLAKIHGIRELFPYNEKMSKIIDLLCRNGSPFQVICKILVGAEVGYNENELDSRLFPLFLSDLPGSGIQQFFHFTQMTKTGIFQKYDYGIQENTIRYGQDTPPVYNLSKVIIPTAIFYSENDYLSSVADADKLANNLPNVVFKYKIKDPEFNHIDFLYAINVVKKVYTPLIDLIVKYT